MRLLSLIILALLLTGCAGAIPENTTETTAMTETVFCEVNTDPVVTESTVPAEPEKEQTPLLRLLVNPKDGDFVRVRDYIPGIVTDLKYGSDDNFTGQVVYEFEDVFLRYGTVMKLKAVSEELAGQGLGLKIWDGFRPVSAQFKLWEICPDDTYVANPNKGYSNHSRGFAVDLTLIDAEGNELEMPTRFDDFSAKADRDYSECSVQARQNATLLETVMEKHGFQGYWGEWWHFNDTQKYEVETCFDPGGICLRQTREAAALLAAAGEDGPEILTVPAGETVTVLGFIEQYSMVEYWGYRGFLPNKSLNG